MLKCVKQYKIRRLAESVQKVRGLTEFVDLRLLCHFWNSRFPIALSQPSGIRTVLHLGRKHERLLK